MSLVLDVREALRGQEGVDRIFINNALRVEVTLSKRVQGLHAKVVQLLQDKKINLSYVDIPFISLIAVTVGADAKLESVEASPASNSDQKWDTRRRTSPVSKGTVEIAAVNTKEMHVVDPAPPAEGFDDAVRTETLEVE